MKNQDIISALVTGRYLTADAGERVLREAESLKKNAEDVIYAKNLVDENELAKIKSGLLKIPYKKIEPGTVAEEVVKLLPLDTARTYRMVPISRAKDMLVVGMVHPDDPTAQQALRFLAQQQRVNLGVYVVTPSDVDAVLKKFSPFTDEVRAALNSLNVTVGEGSPLQKIVRLEEGMSASANDAPIIRIVASILKEAVNAKASDIHVEPQRTRTRVRFRVDGDLHEVMDLPVELSQGVVSRIKVLSSMKLDETRVPQDGRFRTVIFEKEIDFRVSVFPTSGGEKAALRVLDPVVGLKSLEEIGAVGRNLELLKTAIAKPFGMILLTGPTGSGKTTTLYALMGILNKQEVNLISLEDPVEYTIEGVNQSQVRPEIGYDFSTGLRQILRQDPDVIMVGEIRDNETAGLAIHAALTGHIVLSTLHTNNAIGVISRLVDMEVPPFLLSAGIGLMVSQRLVSRLCQNCRKKADASPAITAIVKRELAKLPAAAVAAYRAPYDILHAPGCGVCRQRGVAGRIALFETFQMTPELSELIGKRDFSENKLIEEAKRQGMITLRQDGILKALEGLVNMEDVLRETEEL